MAEPNFPQYKLCWGCDRKLPLIYCHCCRDGYCGDCITKTKSGKDQCKHCYNEPEGEK